MATAPKAANKTAASKEDAPKKTTTKKAPARKRASVDQAEERLYKNKTGIFTLRGGQLFNEAGERTTASAERKKGGPLKRYKPKKP